MLSSVLGAWRLREDAQVIRGFREGANLPLHCTDGNGPVTPPIPYTHSLQRFTMAVLFFAFSVVLASSEGGSSSQDRL